jgi:hypothetical protein
MSINFHNHPAENASSADFQKHLDLCCREYTMLDHEGTQHASFMPSILLDMPKELSTVQGIIHHIVKAESNSNIAAPGKT